MSPCYVPGIILGDEATSVSKTTSLPHEISLLVTERKKKGKRYKVKIKVGKGDREQ